MCWLDLGNRHVETAAVIIQFPRRRAQRLRLLDQLLLPRHQTTPTPSSTVSHARTHAHTLASTTSLLSLSIKASRWTRFFAGASEPGLPWPLLAPAADPDNLLAALLSRGIENSVPEDGNAAELHKVAAEIAAGRRKDLADPGLYEALMGKPDATLMREAVEAALDESKTEDDRV